VCNHKTAGRWGRIWTAWAYTAAGSFAALEAYGLVTEGPDATLSIYLRRRAGLLEPCAHSRLGRLAIVGFSGWLAAHLGWGRFGIAPRRHTHRHNQEVPS
jgi:hypothetical protein